MSSSFIALILAAMVAAVVIRRKMKEPENVFGQWCAKNIRPRMAVAAKVVAYLTLAAWILIFLFAPKDERGSIGELMKSFRNAFGLEETKAPGQPSPDSPTIPPPFRIPGPGETAKPNPARP